MRRWPVDGAGGRGRWRDEVLHAEARHPAERAAALVDAHLRGRSKGVWPGDVALWGAAKGV